MIVKLLTIKEAAEARPSLHMSKYHIVGNHMHWLNCIEGFLELWECYDGIIDNQYRK